MQKQVTINGQDYTVATITAGSAKGITFQSQDPYTSNTAIIAASLRAGGCENAVGVAESIPIFLDDGKFGEVLSAAMEVNGLKPAGETQVATAEPTGDGSTAT